MKGAKAIDDPAVGEPLVEAMWANPRLLSVAGRQAGGGESLLKSAGKTKFAASLWGA